MPRSTLLSSAPATAFPNATCIGATFNTSLAEQMGSILALETLARGAVMLLAPTINIQRHPRGGRAFESFAEDPHLSGTIAGAYVKGLQDGGVSACIKHFVCNDQEHERMGQDSVVQERPLREIYLRPFQIAQKMSQPWAYMTGYNKVSERVMSRHLRQINGLHCSENPWLLQEVLRKEWQFDGIAISDWYGTYSVSDSINAGLNVEFPGPPRWRVPQLLKHLLNAHKLDPEHLDDSITELLRSVQRLAKLHPEVVYAEDKSEKTRYDAIESDKKVVNQIYTEGIVLAKNDEAILPVTKGKVAIIGPNAAARVFTGGGSARLQPSWSSSPWEGFNGAAKPKEVELSYALGSTTAKFLPMFDDCFTSADAGTSVAPTPIDHAHVLVVDDEEGLRSVMISALEDAGCTVYAAADGQEGVEQFQRHREDIDVVVLDLTMPRLNGDEVYRRIRSCQPDTRVIMCSGYTEEDIVRHFDSRGLAGFLEKPFKPSELIEKISAVLAGETGTVEGEARELAATIVRR